MKRHPSPLSPAAVQLIGQLTPYHQSLLIRMAVSFRSKRAPRFASLMTPLQLKEHRNTQRREARGLKRRRDEQMKGGA